MFHTKSNAIRRGTATLLCTLLLAAPLNDAKAATIEYTVTATRVNIRENASTSSDVVTVVSQGETLLLISTENNGWLKVSVSGKTGYVSAEYACLTSLSGSDAVAVVTAERLNIRSTPSTTGKIIAVPGKNAQLNVLGLTDGWLKVSYNGETGYVSPEYVSLSANASATPAPTATVQPTQTPSSTTATTTILKKGSEGSDVKSLQEKLIALGYLTGTADGKFGDSTYRAVQTFQRNNGLTVDGVAGPATLAALNASTIVAPTQVPTPTPTPTPTASAVTTVLKKGDRGDEVKSLQEKLISLGFLSGKADGIFGSDTRDAVKAFQRNQGIDDDGVVGSETLAALSSITVATPAPTQSSETQQPITATLLKKGSEGDEVKALQERLIALGYLTGTADGIFGSATKDAVRAFQRDQGLTADGVAGTLTLAALSSASGTPSVSNPTGATLLKYGDTGDSVKALQTRLKELGYFNGSIGGNFGTITRDAVKAFQTAAGLTADGIAGEKTLTALYASDAPQQENITLKAGDSGDDVKRMQERLIELGYLTGTADGKFGSITQTAVMLFQSAADLTADGIAGQTTLNALYSDSAPAASVPSQPSDDSDSTSTIAEKIIETAKKYLGCKYVYACEDPPYFDCSGLTQYVFKQYGYSLLRTAYQQGYNDKYQKVSLSELKMGDLVFFNTNLTDSDMCDHTGIYIGDGDFIHASSSAGKVIISNLNSGYYNTRFSWGRRILTD